MRRMRTDRRLQSMIVKEERRMAMRRNLEAFRRSKSDRREEEIEVDEERRKEVRRREDVEKLQKENPEYTLPLMP